MSYMHKSRLLSGFGFGSTATVNTATGDDGVRIIQTQLQRLGFLSPGTGPDGVDGKWGPRTESAMLAAARYVSYTDTPFTVVGTTVTVPDDLMNKLQNAPPATASTPGVVTSTSVLSTSSGTVGPAPAPIVNPAAAAASGEGFPWVPVVLVAGGVVAIAAVAYAARRKYPTTIAIKTKPTAVTHRKTYGRRRHTMMRHSARHGGRKPKETIRIY